MNIHRPTVKAQARQAMGAARPRAIPMTLLYLALTSGISILIGLFFSDPLIQLATLVGEGLTPTKAFPLVMAEVGGFGLFCHIFAAIAGIVLGFGYHLWCLGTTRGGIGEYRDLLGGCTMVGRVLLLRLAIVTLSLIWYLVIMMVAMLLASVVLFASPFGLLSILPFFVAAIGLFLWKILHYSLAEFCLMDNPDMGVFHAIGESHRLMRGHCRQFILLALSFFGWHLLGLLIQLAAEGLVLLAVGGPWLLMGDVAGAAAAAAALPLAGVVSALLCWPYSAWLIPYQTMTTCCFYNTLRGCTPQ